MSNLRIGDLKAPFPPDAIHWRVGATTKDKKKGIALAYLDARDVMERLDDVCGPENWQCEYPHVGQFTVCRIGIRVDGEWIWKSNGAGVSDIEGEKGAMSDSFKRAAVLWGVGQYLYDLDSPWVTLEAKGHTHIIASHEYARLHKLLGGQSASQMRKDDPDAFAQFEEDLAQCMSVVAVEGLFREIRKEGWAPQWMKQVIEKCKERKAELTSAANDAEFPGDIPLTQAG